MRSFHRVGLCLLCSNGCNTHPMAARSYLFLYTALGAPNATKEKEACPNVPFGTGGQKENFTTITIFLICDLLVL